MSIYVSDENGNLTKYAGNTGSGVNIDQILNDLNAKINKNDLIYNRFLNSDKKYVSMADCSTYGEIWQLAMSNSSQLIAAIGHLDGDSNVKTLLGNPFDNYTIIKTTSVEALGGAYDESIVEITALGLYVGKIARGYIWSDGANYYWSGWIQYFGRGEKVWQGTLYSGNELDINLDKYKLVRIYYSCYPYSPENYGAKGGVIELRPSSTDWSAASQAIVYNVYNSQTGWSLRNTMGITIAYNPGNHKLSVKMHYQENLQTSNYYYIYEIEGEM